MSVRVSVADGLRKLADQHDKGLVTDLDVAHELVYRGRLMQAEHTCTGCIDCL